MSTYTQILYQIIFTTKYRDATLTAINRNELYKYIAGILKNRKCVLYQIGGVEDHIHIVTHLHPSVALADLVKDIKLASSAHIKANDLFPDFAGWQDGYGAFTYSVKAKHGLVAYVKNQEAHHRKKTSKDEYRELLMDQEIPFDEKYFM
jgi:putative transposase